MGLTRITSDGITDATIATADLATSSVTASRIADNAVQEAKINNGAVTVHKIGTGAVNSSKIADATIGLDKLVHGTSSNDGKFLRANNGADPTFETVNTDLVSDTSPQLGGNLDTNGKNILFGDSNDGNSDDVLKFGSGNDLQLHSDGTNGVVRQNNNSGGLYIQADNFVQIGKVNAGSPIYGKFINSGAVELYHNGNKKFETTSGGVSVTGSVICDTNFRGADNAKLSLGDAQDLEIFHNGTDNIIDCKNDKNLKIVNDTAGGNETMALFDPNGAVELYHNGTRKFRTTSGGVRTDANLEMLDNHELQFGNNVDLKIFHDGSKSVIDDNFGELQIRSEHIIIEKSDGSETYIDCQADGAVELYHDNAKKFETTSSGVDLPTAASEITFLGSGTCRHSIQSPSGSNDVVFTANKLGQNVTANIIFKSSGAGGGSVTEKCRIDSNGHFVPGSNNTFDLGSSSLKWRNIYTNDLNLSNEGGSNDVDGTWGSYTIQEGKELLFLINKRNGKKYKFNLTEVS